MYSKHHLTVSVALGAALAAAFPSPYPWWALVGYAAALGVGIDLDHFVVARLNTGGWAALRRVRRDPRRLVLAQDEIFETDDLWALQRLLSHALVGGALVVALVPVAPYLAAFSAAVCYAHVVADLAWDNRHLGRYMREHADYLAE